MRISSDRSYGFDLDPPALWRAIADVQHFPRWWPWLERFEATGLVAGDVWRCTVRPPLPYTLTFAITIDEVVPDERVTATIGGEITGRAELTLATAPEGCTARLTSKLAPASRFLQGVALVARPVVTLGHDWVLDTGARQFRQHLGVDP